MTFEIAIESLKGNLPSQSREIAVGVVGLYVIGELLDVIGQVEADGSVDSDLRSKLKLLGIEYEFAREPVSFRIGT